MKLEKLPKGWRCTCGAEHRFPMWVYAHGRDLIKTHCTECGRPWNVLLFHAQAARRRAGEKGRPWAEAIYES